MATSSAVKVTANDIIMPGGGLVDGVDVSTLPALITAAQAAADEADDTADAAGTLAAAAAPASRTLTASTGLTGGGSLAANRSFACDFGSGAGKVCEGNDARLSDARTPSTHASSHKDDGADALLPSIITEATTARTLALTDAGDYVNCTSGSATAVTVPPNSSVAFPIGTMIAVVQAGAGAVTITQGAGVTVNPPKGGSLVVNGQHARVVLVKKATDEWDLWGNTVPS